MNHRIINPLQTISFVSTRRLAASLAVVASMGVIAACGAESPDNEGASSELDGSSGAEVHGSTGRSCDDGLDCGGVDCCQNTRVPGGTFQMGRSEAAASSCSDEPGEDCPRHPASVDTFDLDTFEVTVGRFRKFVDSFDGQGPAAGAGDHHGLGAGWQTEWDAYLPESKSKLVENIKCGFDQTWTDTPGQHELLAMNCVSWIEAFAFCVWDGGRLPTEAEWEYAAAGGSENRLYPWGSDDPSVNTALANSKYSEASPLLPVGTHPLGNGKWGHRDLAGNVWELVFDWDNALWYANAGADCSNCANASEPDEMPARVIRGGSYDGMYGEGLRTASRTGFFPTSRSFSVGFRCAR